MLQLRRFEESVVHRLMMIIKSDVFRILFGALRHIAKEEVVDSIVRAVHLLGRRRQYRNGMAHVTRTRLPRQSHHQKPNYIQKLKGLRQSMNLIEAQFKADL